MFWLSIAVVASGTAPAAHVVVQPNWAVTPSGSEMASHYPDAAMVGGSQGEVTLVCTVTVDGHAAACKVISEAPEGEGFGLAALAMAQDFRFRPKTVDGVPVGDGSVTVPLHFKAPPLTPAELKNTARCAAWAKATLDAMTPPVPAQAQWAYDYWRRRYDAYAKRSGVKPADALARLNQAAVVAAPRRLRAADQYKDCLFASELVRTAARK